MTQNIYDIAPYTENVYPQTHPYHLASLATLRGLNPPDINNAKILELGCASGSNLISMAQQTPQAELVGIDYSQHQIDLAQQKLDFCQLDNVFFKQADILQLTEDLGQFDYIIAHGLYSWIGEKERHHLMQLLSKLLSKNGIIYISYNILPGWQQDKTIRDLLFYHLEPVTDFSERVIQGKQLLKKLQNQLENRFDEQSLQFRKKLDYLIDLDDDYFAHEHLEPNNYTPYFHEFMQHALQHNLQYVTDANIQFCQENYHFPDIEQIGSEFIQQEQYMDGLKNRAYRESVLCHADIELSPKIQLDQLLNKLYFTAPLQPLQTEDLFFTETCLIKTLHADVVSLVEQPFLKLVCHYLAESYPQTLSFSELIQNIETQLSQALSSDEKQDIQQFIVDIYLQGHLKIYTQAFSHQHKLQKALPLTRWQASRSKVVTNYFGHSYQLGLAARQILQHLDGNQQQADLVKVLWGLIETGKLKIQADDVQNAEQSLSDETIQSFLEQTASQILLDIEQKQLIM
ncbi:class I SAM-dependent methyltransferase [Candidatus Albibeggiatoa sp. nov. NOAA]|uniref:class I SAM-dependent methyltransferase n=1 Tax=Candidatus Albibeggiatoa sp. nov. NOAA TaxID=3162724 RepID=UPI0032F2E6C7|nr:class I SAM-dependent methyltransferase [Thiotrichaceae bacterium]